MDIIDVQSILGKAFQHIDSIAINTIKNLCVDFERIYEEKYKKRLYIRCTRDEFIYMERRWPHIFIMDYDTCRLTRNYMPTREEVESIFYSGFDGSNDYSVEVWDILKDFNWREYRK